MKTRKSALLKKVCSILLAIVMLLSNVNFSVLAAGVSDMLHSENRGQYNEQLLAELQALCTDGQDATEILDKLREYGLVDESGMPIIGSTFDVNGTEMTEEELVAEIATHDADEVATIDGIETTWGQMQTLIDIRNTADYLYEFLNPDGAIDENALASLSEQLQNGGLKMPDMRALPASFPSGIKRDAMVSVTANVSPSSVKGSSSITVTASIPSAVSYPIKFKYRAVSGTATLSGSGDATIAAGSTSTTVTVQYDGSSLGSWKGSKYGYVQFYDLENAAFTDGTTFAQTIVKADSNDDLSTGYVKYAYGSGTPPTGQMSSVNWTINFNLSGINTTAFRCVEIENKATYNLNIVTPSNNSNNEYSNVTARLADYSQVGSTTIFWTKAAGPTTFSVAGKSTYDGNGIEAPASMTVTTSRAGSAGTAATYEFGSAVGTPEFKMTLKNLRNEVALTGLHIPDGIFYTGQTVPVTATFDVPLAISSGMKLELTDGTVLTPKEDGSQGTAVTFEYTVPNTPSGTISVKKLTFENVTNPVGTTMGPTHESETVGDVKGFDLQQYVTDAAGGVVLSNNNCKTQPVKINVFTGFKLQLSNDPPLAQWVMATLPIDNSNSELRDWVQSEVKEISGINLEDRTDLAAPTDIIASFDKYTATSGFPKAQCSIMSYSTSLYLSPDNGVTRYPFYLVIKGTGANEELLALVSYYKPAQNVGTSDREDVVELFMDPVIGNTTDYFTDPAAAPVMVSKFKTDDTYGSYTVKKALLSYEGSAKIKYDTDDLFAAKWADIAPLDGSGNPDLNLLKTYALEVENVTDVGLKPKKTGDNYTYIEYTDLKADATTGQMVPDSAAGVTYTGKPQADKAFDVVGTEPTYKQSAVPNLMVANDLLSDNAVGYQTQDFYAENGVLEFTAEFDGEYTFLDSDNMIWVSSNDQVANVVTSEIKNNGKVVGIKGVVTPTGKVGSAYFTLYGLNAGIANYTPVEICRTITLNMKVGMVPFINIPKQNGKDPLLFVRSGSALDVCYTSNLTARNASSFIAYEDSEHPGHTEQEDKYPTEFTLQLYETDASGNKGAAFGEPIKVSSTNEATIGKITTQVISSGVTAKDFDYIAEVSATSKPVDVDPNTGKAQYGAEEVITATAHIKVLPSPIKIKLQKPDTYFYLSDETINIPYTIQGLSDSVDRTYTVVDSSGNVVDTKTGAEISASGSFSFQPTQAAMAGKLKEVYVVTLEAKAQGLNEVIESTDSFVFYFYNKDAMDIIVRSATDAADAGSTGQDGTEDKFTLDNSKWIEELLDDDSVVITRKTLTELANDTNLAKLVSLNYQNFPWGRISDQIKWTLKTSLTSKADSTEGSDPENPTPPAEPVEVGANDKMSTTFNLRRGGAFSDLRSYSYLSYSPYEDFMAVGLENGTTTVTATHAMTGMQTQIQIDVNTVKDKLYLFRFYPKTKTKVVYTNGDGEERTIESNDAGELSLYEESGINSNVQLYSNDGGSAYIGTIQRTRLLSKEDDFSKLRTYPINNCKLRDVSNVKMYIKNPDGTPYASKSFTLRGGVYKNGEYCPAALLGQSSGLVNADGKADQNVTTDANGMFQLFFDSSAFYTEKETDPVDRELDPNDALEYIFELRFSDSENFQPQIVHIKAEGNAQSAVRAGDSIITHRVMPTDKNTPFITAQRFDSYRRETKELTIAKNLYGTKEPTGISFEYPYCELLTESFFLGYDVYREPFKLDGVEVPGQEITVITPEETEKFQTYYTDLAGYKPKNQEVKLVTYPFSSFHVVENNWKMEKEEIDKWVPNQETSATQIVYDVDKATVKSETNSFAISNTSDNDPMHDDKMNDTEGEAADAVASKLSPGAIFKTISSDEQTSPAFAFLQGLDVDSGIPIGITLSATSDPNTFRSVITIGKMDGAGDDDDDDDDDSRGEYDSQYDDEPDDEEPEDEDFDPFTVPIGPAKLTIGGYFTADISYNGDTDEWSLTFVGGGLKSALSVGKQWSNNFMVGPVPATVSFGIGAEMTMGFNFKISTVNGEKVNDFLTEIGAMAYVDAFAGVGFDLTIVAFKLGVFGRIQVDTTLKVLNQAGSLTPKVGNMTGLGGSVGLKMTVKVLFISYEQIFASTSWRTEFKTSEYSKIEDYWENGVTREGKTFAAYNSGDGTTFYSIADAIMEDRDYLNTEERAWVSVPKRSRSLDATNLVSDLQTYSYPYANPVYNDDGSIIVYITDSDSENLQDTLASYATLSGGGAYTNQFGIDPTDYTGTGSDLFVNGTDTPITPGSGDGDDPVFYPASAGANAGKVISPERKTERTGYGDTSVTAAGTKDFTVAAWVRQVSPLIKEAGEKVSQEDLNLMMNSTEIMVSVYNGTGWTTEQLTVNTSPDLAPMVATTPDGKAIVVWRQVSASSAGDPLNFDTMNNLLYKIYDGMSWGDTKILYNGDTGTVNALQVKMMPDGTAMVGYTLNTFETQSLGADATDDGRYTETMYTIIKPDGTPGRTVRVTNDENTDQNVQLTAVDWKDEDYFVLAWFTENDVQGNGETKGDIRLLAVNKDGIPSSDFVESVSEVSSTKVTRLFSFSVPGASTVADPSGGANTYALPTLDQLSIVWAETLEGSAGQKEEAGKVYLSSGTDILQAVRFFDRDESIGVTMPIEVATMPADTKIDTFSTYMDTLGQMRAVILGTGYQIDWNDANSYETQTIPTTHMEVDANGNAVVDADGNPKEIVEDLTIYTAVGTTNMYTATGVYTQNDFTVESKTVKASSIYRDSIIPVEITVTNTGINTIKCDGISLGKDAGGAYNTAVPFDREILPAQSATFQLEYEVPGNVVLDVDYQVSCSTVLGRARGLNESKEGTLILNMPDLSINDFSIAVETEKTRTMRLTVSNSNDIPLENGTHTVKIALYGSVDDRAAGTNALVETSVSDNGTLSMIDNGGYVWMPELTAVQTQALLNAQYSADQLKASGGEIPQGGIMVFAKAWVESADTDADGNNLLVKQGRSIDNEEYCTLNSLIKKSGGNDLTFQSNLNKITQPVDPTDPDNKEVMVTGVEVQASVMNNSYVRTLGGNLVTALIDKDGQVISAVKQSYDRTILPDHGIKQVAPESTSSDRVTFDESDLLDGYKLEDAVTAYVAYADVDETDVSAKLSFFNVKGAGATVAEFEKARQQAAQEPVDPDAPVVPQGPYVEQPDTVEKKTKSIDGEGWVVEENGTDADVNVRTFDYELEGEITQGMLNSLIAGFPRNPGDTVTLTANGGSIVTGIGSQLATRRLYGETKVGVKVEGRVFDGWGDLEGNLCTLNADGNPVNADGNEILDATGNLKAEFAGLYEQSKYQNVRNYVLSVKLPAAPNNGGNTSSDNEGTGKTYYRTMWSDDRYFAVTEHEKGNLTGAILAIEKVAMDSNQYKALTAILNHNGVTFNGLGCYEVSAWNLPNANSKFDIAYKAGDSLIGKELTLIQYTHDGYLKVYKAVVGSDGFVEFMGVSGFGTFVIADQYTSTTYVPPVTSEDKPLEALPEEERNEEIAEGEQELVQPATPPSEEEIKAQADAEANRIILPLVLGISAAVLAAAAITIVVVMKKRKSQNGQQS